MSLRARLDPVVARLGRHAALLIVLVGWLGMLWAEHAQRDHAIQGVWFQAWSSERMAQTVSIADLARAPFDSLYFLHIQPPALDAIRALAAIGVSATDPMALLRAVDGRLYVVWALVYACTAGLLFAWLSALGRRGLAFATAGAFLLHPAAIFSATLLDSTGLSALAILWFHYELWRFTRSAGSVPRLAGSSIVLFLTRSIFQWPFLVLVALCLLLLRVPWRLVARFAVIAGLVVAAYTAKQYVMFGVTYSSTLAGYNCVRGIGHGPPDFEPAPALRDLPAVLARDYKINGSPNYNQITYLGYNAALMAHCKAAIAALPASELLASYRQNLEIYLLPSSRYTPNLLVDGLPWRPLYDGLFHGAPLVLVMLAAIAFWCAGHARQWRSGLALALPSVFIVLVSITFEKGENMRFKFFTEPVWMLFLALQLADAVKRLASSREPRPA